MDSYVYKPTALMLDTSYYDKRRADFAVGFIGKLSHTSGARARKQFKLMPWQEQIVRDIFGIVDKETGYRQFRTCYCEVPKKNGKSELAAAIALYMLFADGEMGGEIYSCACDKAQAGIVYNVAKRMVENYRPLKDISKIVDSTKRIMFPHTNSFYRVMSKAVDNKQGFNVSGLIFDELFAQPNRELFDTMTKYTSDARQQPLHFLITTAGRDKNSICYEQHQKSRAILDGTKHDPSYYPVLFGLDPEKDDWQDEAVWLRCNPAIGTILDIETVRAAAEQAKQNPGEENHFRQFRLNEWTNQDIRWLPMDKWNSCGEDFAPDDLEGCECYCGLDLSSTEDLTALVLVFPPIGGDERYTIVPFFWLPEDAIPLRSRRDHVPYEKWCKQGVFNTTPGGVVDYEVITEFIKTLSDKYEIKEIAYDRWGAEKIRRDLEEIGAECGFEVFPFGQGYGSMSPASKNLFQMILEKKIRHGKHTVLDWNMSNTIVEQDAAGNIKPHKKKSTERIDGCIATIMALSRATAHANDSADSVYDTRGLLIL